MSTGRRASDLLNVPAQTRGQDRRAADRRAPRRRIDPIFAATLINQIAPPEAQSAFAYETTPDAPKPGASINFRA
jgi:hypothetical protein